MKYDFNVDCIEFTPIEYDYLCSLSCLATFAPTKQMFQVFNGSRGHMYTNNLIQLPSDYGNLSVSTAFLHENFTLIKLTHAAIDNSNIEFMHNLQKILFPNAQFT